MNNNTYEVTFDGGDFKSFEEMYHVWFEIPIPKGASQTFLNDVETIKYSMLKQFPEYFL